MNNPLDEKIIEALRNALSAAGALILAIHDVQKRTGLVIIPPPDATEHKPCLSCSCARHQENGCPPLRVRGIL